MEWGLSNTPDPKGSSCAPQMVADLTKDSVFMITATHHRATFVKPEGA
jgi:hypothetical protein